MDLLDALVVAMAFGAAVGGWRVGLTARATSWLGMALGLFAASKLLPTVVEQQSGQSAQGLLLVIIAVLLGGALLGQVIGYVVGIRLRVAIPPAAERADRFGGAVAGLVGVAIALWLLLPTLADTPGWAAEQARGSFFAGLVHDHLPQPPDTMRALRRLVGDDLFPRVLDGLGQAPSLGAPPPASGLDAALADRVAASTVLVESDACSRVREGSGAVIADGLIVTNAHVVAGASSTRVFRHPDGTELRATIVAFDPQRDVAILAVPGISRPALPVDDGSFGEGGVGAVFGHPLGGPLAVQPFSVGRVADATGRDIYDNQRSERKVMFLASHLQPGDSGGALVDARGYVVGVAFAIAPDDPNVAYALTVDEVKPVLQSAGTAAVDPGPCLEG